MMNVAYLCLGGNIGDRESTINEALSEIESIAGNVFKKSNIYETAAWGVKNQQAYLNQCVVLHTELSSEKLIATLLKIEQKLGRKRDESSSYAPRTIDIDILFYNNDIINLPNLVIPHPRLHLRKFVLIPLNEIAENYLHPVLKQSIFNLLQVCNDNLEVKRIRS